MHDTQIEELLRGVLRAEGDGIPLTITTAELERRLAARRRATGGRRLSLVAAAVAAIAVVSIVAAGNGWLKLPAIGTVPSPSASAAESAGTLDRIERGPGDVVLEIAPTWSGTGANPSIEKQLVPTDFVVSIRVACLGAGMITFEERDRAVSESCESVVGVPRAPDEPIAHRVPTSDGYLSVRFTVSAAVTYAILVETVPLPSRLPSMSAPEGIVDIDASSDSDQPARGLPHTTRSLSVGVLPASPTQRLALVCLGSGVLSYALASTSDPAAAINGEILCDGAPEFDVFSVDAAEAHDLRITTETLAAWHVMASHDAAPSESPSPGPPSGRVPLGRPDQAILVKPIGASWTTPDSLEVSRFDPTDQSSQLIAMIPGSVLPSGMWISPDAKAVVSATGWLEIPMRPGESSDTESTVVFVDLLDPTATPRSISGPQSGSWYGDTFATIGEGGVQLFDPASGFLRVAPITDPAVSVATLVGPKADPIWTTAPNGRFLGRRDTGETPSGPQGWGVISVDGTFNATTNLPPTYQRTGLERPAGADAHQFTLACTGGGTVTEAGCSLVEIDATGVRVATRVSAMDYRYLADSAWAANGRDAWLLFGTSPDSGRGADGIVSLSLSKPDGSRQEYSQLHVGGGDFAILGIAQSADGLPIVAIGSRDSWLRSFVVGVGGDLHAGSPGYAVGLEESSWFAGWAGPQPDYDPD